MASGIITSTSSGLKTSDAAIRARPAALCSVTVLTDGTNAATAIIYDNASAASGTVLAKVIVAGADRVAHIAFDSPVEASNGIYLDIGGTGAECIVTTYAL